MSTHVSETGSILLGALCPPLSKQLEGVLPLAILEHMDRQAAAIDLLAISGVIVDSEKNKARRRLMKRVFAELEARKKS